MKREVDWNRSLKGSVIPWLFAAFFLLVAFLVARLTPASLLVTLGVASVALLPRFRSIRTATFWALLTTWGLMLVPASLLPGLVSSAGWQAAFLFDAAALLAAEVAQEEGLGVPMWRFLRSRKVQGWSALVFCGLWAIGGVLAVDGNLKRSALPHEWRWSLVPLVLMCLAPKAWIGGSGRVLWGFSPLILAGAYWITHYRDQSSEMVMQIIISGCQVLWVAGYAHEGWAKTRPPQPQKPPDLGGPVRVHGGSGLP